MNTPSKPEDVGLTNELHVKLVLKNPKQRPYSQHDVRHPRKSNTPNERPRNRTGEREVAILNSR